MKIEMQIKGQIERWSEEAEKERTTYKKAERHINLQTGRQTCRQHLHDLFQRNVVAAHLNPIKRQNPNRRLG